MPSDDEPRPARPNRLTIQQDSERPGPQAERCEVCGSQTLVWRNCKLICTNCRSILKSCADL